MAAMTGMEKRRTRVAAYVVLVNAGRIALCRLSPRVAHAAGRWTLPGGGVEFGEDPAMTVARETREETGLTAVAHEVLHVGSKLTEWPEGEVHSIQLIYRGSLEGAPEPLVFEQNGSTDMCGWHPLQEVQALPLTDVSKWALTWALAQP